MPREHREMRPEMREKKLSPKATSFLSKVNSDIRALNSSILILSQKMKFIVRNEKILGRNLVVLNKRIREGGTGGGVGSGDGADSAGLKNELANLNARLEENSVLVQELRSEIETIKETYSRHEEVKEIKFVVDAINPLEFVTRKDLEEILGKKIEQKHK